MAAAHSRQFAVGSRPAAGSPGIGNTRLAGLHPSVLADGESISVREDARRRPAALQTGISNARPLVAALPPCVLRSRHATLGTPLCTLLLLALVVVLAAAGCHREPEGLPQPPPPPKLVSQDPWRLTIREPGPARAYLGNGYLGVSASQEGWARDGEETLPGFLSGYYVGESFAPGPDWAAPVITVNGRRLSPDGAREYEQTLDLSRGLLQTRYRQARRPGVLVEATLFPARHDPYLGVLQVSLTPERHCTLTVDPAFTARPEVAAVTQDRMTIPGQASMPLPAGPIRLRKGETLTLTRYAGVCHRRDAADRQGGLARRSVEAAVGLGFPEVLRRHTAAWEKLWERDIAIAGDPRVQQVVNAFRYYLLASVREDVADSVPPMGLSSSIYQGHIFWDADVWVFPALVPQYPELARSLVEYRYRTLPAARENARRQGLPGADYVWQSAAIGRENAPGDFARGRHVTAGVALAQWQYYLWTGDREWLRTRGYPVLRDTADCWAGRADLNQAAGRYEIRGVMGPDETRGPVDNNAWTNSMAQLNLQLAARAAEILGERPDPRWAEVARKLWIPFDKAAGRYRQCDGADGRAKQADCELILYPRRLAMPPEVAARTYDFYRRSVIRTGPAMTFSIHAIIAAQLGRPQEAAECFRESSEPFLVAPYHLFSERRTNARRTCFVTGLAGSLQAILYGFAGLEPTEAGLRAHPLLPRGWTGLRVTGIRWRGESRAVVVK
ncbi:MAG: glycoside hydrolase family 65 protein [Armatimonadetes bacterium]|nr:glycoside hydrolase family 65 protein [Armatimonadota bacterium]